MRILLRRRVPIKTLNIVSLLILIIGGLNWLSIGLFEWDLVSKIFDGSDTVGAKVVYIIIGLSALYALTFLSKVNAEE
ncbi:hypothetical protein PAECIP111893_04812 [Paenibacillus plantiphilus]|uniref:DUF378 domain-containing protein n=1 Tax=Paenibacillus plantiphilus TaxID=2905650 RepID=A0ABN8H108_9BACL|nr:DUF378 domain-containing protein [Paenibacillus plantiphilus]CAH1222091.1 hypothetical protein PAECIP111893_04812 [Paenibacillus plantiphilus]